MDIRKIPNDLYYILSSIYIYGDILKNDIKEQDLMISKEDFDLLKYIFDINKIGKHISWKDFRRLITKQSLEFGVSTMTIGVRIIKKLIEI